MSTVKIYPGDCRKVLAKLADNSVHCVVTSPPYFGLRDYGIPASIWGGDLECEHEWGDVYVPPPGGKGTQSSGLNGAQTSAKYRERLQEQHQMKGVTTYFCVRCNAWRGSFGLEPTCELYVEHAVEVFREVRRVLRDDGTLWLNLGDSYANDGKWGGHTGGKHAKVLHSSPIGRNKRYTGLKPKDLIGIPWMVAFALRADGWWLRQDIIWSKPNPMPESVTDRCTKAHEYLFLLSKSERYYYDQDAIREEPSGRTDPIVSFGNAYKRTGTAPPKMDGLKGANRRSGWTVDSSGNGGRAAGNKTHKYVTEYNAAESEEHRTKAGLLKIANIAYPVRNKRSVWTVATQPFSEAHFATFPPALIRPAILAGCPQGGVVLDPFAGSGTVAVEAAQLDRDSVLIELNSSYVDMITARLARPGFLASKVELVKTHLPRLSA